MAFCVALVLVASNNCTVAGTRTLEGHGRHTTQRPRLGQGTPIVSVNSSLRQPDLHDQHDSWFGRPAWVLGVEHTLTVPGGQHPEENGKGRCHHQQ